MDFITNNWASLLIIPSIILEIIGGFLLKLDPEENSPQRRKVATRFMIAGLLLGVISIAFSGITP